MAAIVPAIVSTATGLDEVGQGVLSKKIEHYRQMGYAVLPAGSYPDTPLVSDDYVVVSYPFHDILTVPVSKKSDLQSGTRLFFEPSVRFAIEGSLQGRFVVLNSVLKEQLYLGTLKSDTNWQGIHVAESGSLDLSRAVLSGADTLIAADAPMQSLQLECLELRTPGSCPITVGDECLFVDNPSCFTPPEPGVPLAESEMPSAVPDDNATSLKVSAEKSMPPPPTTKYPVLRKTSKWATIGFAALAAGAGIAACTYHREAGEYQSEENRATSADNAIQAHENLALH